MVALTASALLENVPTIFIGSVAFLLCDVKGQSQNKTTQNNLMCHLHVGILSSQVLFYCSCNESICGKILLSMPKPNNFVFKFLKTKKRNFDDINVPKIKMSKSELISFLLQPVLQCLFCLVGDITVHPDKTPNS